MGDHSTTVVTEVTPSDIRTWAPDAFPIDSPYSSAWHSYYTITSIPEDSVGWLVSQGWVISGVSPDTSTVPITYTYSLYKYALNHWAALSDVMTTYMQAHNAAISLNTFRYNDVIASWTRMLAETHDHFGVQSTEQNNHIEVFLGDLDTYMDAVDTLISENTTSISGMITAVNSLVGTMDTRMTEHATDHDAKALELLADYDAHASETRRLLDAIRLAEEARIDEKYTASLSTQQQALIDRGLDSSGLLPDAIARNTRDHSQEVGELYDNLNKQRLSNQHTLYGQQFAMRNKIMDWAERLFGLRQALLQYKVAQERQDVESTVEHKHKAIVETMNVAQARLQGLAQIHDEDMKLMAYQLDEQNKLLIGLYGFVERREDIGPSWDQFAKMAVALGDSGGGWVTP